MTQPPTPPASPPLSFVGPACRSSPWGALAAIVVLITVTVATYGRVCGHEFTWWDDQMTLHHNPRYNPPTAEGIRETWLKPVDGLYAPVTYNYWGTLAYLAELPDIDETGIHLDARVFHTGSLVLHALSVLVAFAILKLLSENVLASAGGAMLFALHPVQVETVAWASGAKDLLCGLLSLCAVYQYVRFARAERVRSGAGNDDPSRPTARAVWTAYGTGAFLMLLAMLSKPTAMVVPAVVAAVDLFVIRRPWRKVVAGVAGWGVVALPLVVVARVAQVADGVADVAFWQRPLIAADAVTFYLWKLVWPVAMTPDYARRPSAVLAMLGGAWPYVVWVVPAALAVGLWRKRLARPWVVAGALVFVAGIAPVLGLTPFMFQYTSTTADHYLYLSMFGPALLLTWALVRYRGRGLVAACAVAFAVLAVRSNDQLRHWRTDTALWTHTIAVNPRSFVGHSTLAADFGREGYVLGRRATAAREQGRTDEAAALEARRTTNYERAVGLLERAIELRPTYLVARHNAFINYLRLGRPEKAVEQVEAMLALNDRLPLDQRSNFNTYHDTAGILWMRVGRYDRAIEHFEKLLAAVPDHASAKAGLAESRSKLAEVRIDPAARE